MCTVGNGSVKTYWAHLTRDEIFSRLRNAALPEHMVPLSYERQPFKHLEEQTILDYLDFFSMYPEALGRLSQATKVAFDIQMPCPREYTIKESHFDLNSLEPDILRRLIPLGFEPDHFATLNPVEYKWCLTMKMEIPHGSPTYAQRVKTVHDMMFRNSLEAQRIAEEQPNIFGYLEIETYSSKSRHVIPFKDVSPEGLDEFPFETNEFEQIQPPSTEAEARHAGLPLDIHKRIDIHVKVPTEARGASFLGADSPRMKRLRALFIESGFYEIYSEAGNHIYTVQLLDPKPGKRVFNQLQTWANSYGGIIGIKMESCNYFYRTPRKIKGVTTLAPIPNLVKWRKAA
jgi:hypothetical protein